MYSDLQPNSRDLAAIPITAAAICISLSSTQCHLESLQIAGTLLPHRCQIAAYLSDLAAIWRDLHRCHSDLQQF
jgi:hypothetical protein